MKKINIQILIAILSALPILAGAQLQGISGLSPVSSVNIPAIVNGILSFAVGLLVVLAALFIIYAAYLYLTAAGEEDKVKKAKNYIVYAVVAIIVAFLAQGLIFLVTQLFSVAVNTVPTGS